MLERARGGDPEAARTLYARYSAYVRVAVRRQLHPRLRSQFDSLDFVQDVWTSFLTAPADPARFETPAALLSFLSRMAHNKLVDAVREQFQTAKRDVTREEPLGETTAGMPDRGPSPSQWAVAGERWEQLVGHFPAGHRAILERLRAGYTALEIAEQAGVSVSTVNRIVRRLKDLTGM